MAVPVFVLTLAVSCIESVNHVELLSVDIDRFLYCFSRKRECECQILEEYAQPIRPTQCKGNSLKEVDSTEEPNYFHGRKPFHHADYKSGAWFQESGDIASSVFKIFHHNFSQKNWKMLRQKDRPGMSQGSLLLTPQIEGYMVDLLFVHDSVPKQSFSATSPGR